MDFVRSDDTVDRLLLTLIEKVDDNSRMLDELIKREDENVLAGYRPFYGFTVQEEAHEVKKDLDRQRYHHRLDAHPRNHPVILAIEHAENIRHLEANGCVLSPRPIPGVNLSVLYNVTLPARRQT